MAVPTKNSLLSTDDIEFAERMLNNLPENISHDLERPTYQ